MIILGSCFVVLCLEFFFGGVWFWVVVVGFWVGSGSFVVILGIIGKIGSRGIGGGGEMKE